MQKIKIILAVLCCCMFFNEYTYGQVAPKYSNEFMSIGVGARALGMGNSVVTTSNDVYSTYWNPSNLLSAPFDVQVAYMHSEYFAGITKYDFGGATYKIDDIQSVGISLIRLGVDNIPNTLDLIDADGNIRYDRVKNFSVADYGLTFSYARDLGIDGLNVGANVKIIRRIAGDFASAWGFGLDAAASYSLNKWKLALLARDVTSTFNAWSYNKDELSKTFELTGNTIPNNSLEITLPKFIFAASRMFTFKEKFHTLIETSLDFTTDGKRNVLLKTNFVSIDPHVGVEFNYDNLFYVRGGFINLQKEKIDNKNVYTLQPTIGVGLKLKHISIDYAYTNLGGVSQIPYSNIVSISYGLNKF